MAAGPRGWVSIDARVPNALIAEELIHRRLGPFQAYREVQREAPLEGGRVDFQLLGEGRPPCLIEVKSVTLVVEGVARFPDARTERGVRHVRALAEGVSAGLRGAILFVIQRPDAWAFSPNDAADPDFGQALRAAAQRGVEVYARTCRVSPRRITLDQEVPVGL
jgi:sugar fermentation stimulation protein A